MWINRLMSVWREVPILMPWDLGLLTMFTIETEKRKLSKFVEDTKLE